jgi:hypothetical protein
MPTNTIATTHLRTSARWHLRTPFLLAALLLVGVPCAAGSANAAELTGYGKAKFGSTSAAVKKLYPKAREVAATDKLAAPFIGGPFITRLLLENQTIPGLPKPILVELRFWKDQLWGVIGYFGENTDQQVLDMLTKQLGPPQANNPAQVTWSGTKTQTIVSPRLRWYGTTDDALSTQAQAWLAEQIEKAKQHQHQH